jgi:hypothetical protein
MGDKAAGIAGADGLDDLLGLQDRLRTTARPTDHNLEAQLGPHAEPMGHEQRQAVIRHEDGCWQACGEGKRFLLSQCQLVLLPIMQKHAKVSGIDLMPLASTHQACRCDGVRARATPCSHMRAAITWRLRGMIPGPFRTIWAIKIFSIPYATPLWRPTGSKASGMIKP